MENSPSLSQFNNCVLPKIMSLKIFLFVILGLLLITNESESIRCYRCNNLLDGQNCHTANNLTELECSPHPKYCFKMTGLRKRLSKILFLY